MCIDTGFKAYRSAYFQELWTWGNLKNFLRDGIREVFYEILILVLMYLPEYAGEIVHSNLLELEPPQWINFEK